MEPAASIIRLFGGASAVAAIVGKHPSRVYRWTYPEDIREGGGGLVPSRDQVTLLSHAKAHNIDLRPEDFFSPDRLQQLLVETAVVQ
ncbi:MAG: hypothetical protein EOP24_34290 [Hyphomicrobiales bacterium]|nr:MAG: hypothetical protein EOP24_34290 [Hyphomicrobiales bacterium]